MIGRGPQSGDPEASAAEPLGDPEVEERRRILQVVQPHDADTAVLAVLQPERGVLVAVVGAAVDRGLCVGDRRPRHHMERERVARQEGDEGGPVVTTHVRRYEVELTLHGPCYQLTGSALPSS